jgi:hypothetical protein
MWVSKMPPLRTMWVSKMPQLFARASLPTPRQLGTQFAFSALLAAAALVVTAANPPRGSFDPLWNRPFKKGTLTWIQSDDRNSCSVTRITPMPAIFSKNPVVIGWPSRGGSREVPELGYELGKESILYSRLHEILGHPPCTADFCDGSGGFDAIVLVTAGWPIACADGLARISGAGQLRGEVLSFRGSTWKSPYLIPLRLRTPGVIANLGSWWCLIAITQFIYSLARSCVRNRNSLCIACGHRLTNLRICPECGTCQLARKTNADPV